MEISTPQPTSFAQLDVWLGSLPDQVDGDPCSVCQTGETYVEFMEYALSRPDDISFIEGIVAQRMCRDLAQYFRDRKGRIYWRKRLEHEIVDASVIVRFDDNGPDLDFTTDRKCVKDHNWKRVSCYCRLYRSPLQTMEHTSPRMAA